jgi:hypothetical protein
MRTEAEILEAVADGYESGRYGWLQGAYEHGSEAFCSMGAIFHEHRLSVTEVYGYSSLREYQERSKPVERAQERLNEALGLDGAGSIILWNDTHGRTKDEVIDAFKNAAKNARNQETP